MNPDEATPPDLVAPAGPPDPKPARSRSRSRSTAEFLIVLMLGILVARAFAAEAYIVPTGSMAPTLLGMHRDILCTNCGKRFALGMDESGRAGRPVCPNCGQTELEDASTAEGLGDRLLVQKFVYDFRLARRWEVAVFQNPADPSQAYVKRIVALPNETVLLSGGDVYIDGRIARKTPAEARAMAIPVYDHNFTPKDLARYPRWYFRSGDGRDPAKSAWKADGSRFVREATQPATAKIDWVEYRHWQADRGGYGPIRDFTSYNGGDVPGENRVRDLIVSAKIALGEGCSASVVRVDSGPERFVVTIPRDPTSAVEILRNGRRVPVGSRPRSSNGTPSGFRDVEVMVVDRRLSVTIDGVAAFAPLDFDESVNRPPTWSSPVAFGVVGEGSAEMRDIRIDRDVYYTTSLSQTPRRPFGVEVPYILGPGEYFVLGDNSPVSNDSRFWPVSPVVTSRQWLGKPFLVHLPSQAVPLRVFGREVYWVPDPREIRYIR